MRGAGRDTRCWIFISGINGEDTTMIVTETSPFQTRGPEDLRWHFDKDQSSIHKRLQRPRPTGWGSAVECGQDGAAEETGAKFCIVTGDQAISVALALRAHANRKISSHICASCYRHR